MLKSRELGFSLIEMLAVVSIFFVLGVVSLITWNSFAPVMLLNSSARAVGDALELCMQRALSENNDYLVILNYEARLYQTTSGQMYHFPSNSYVMVDDDGWLATGERSRKYNQDTKWGGKKQEFAEDYVLGGTDYTTKIRNNNMMEPNELFKGPLRLSHGISFITPPDNSPSVRRIVFSYRNPTMYWQSSLAPSNRPIASTHRQTEPARIYLADRHYRPANYDPDNKAHLRLIRVTERKVLVIRPD